MRGFTNHLMISLLLNARNRQALIFGYVVPVFFLIAFASIFAKGGTPVAKTMGSLLVISVLGGACFGMPITLVNERERGVWRRYRLTPLGSGVFVTSTMTSRFLLVASSAVLQLALAVWIYHLPIPPHPLDLLIAFTLISFAFIGIGLIIAAVASSVGAVQALGQSLFLPMIMIGGVGIPLYNLPPWAQDFSLFLPGRYAVELLNRCFTSDGLARAQFHALALLAIGSAATLVGWKLFRWEAEERLPRSAWAWVAFSISVWVAVGVLAKVFKLA